VVVLLLVVVVGGVVGGVGRGGGDGGVGGGVGRPPEWRRPMLPSDGGGPAAVWGAAAAGGGAAVVEGVAGAMVVVVLAAVVGGVSTRRVSCRVANKTDKNKNDGKRGFGKAVSLCAFRALVLMPRLRGSNECGLSKDIGGHTTTIPDRPRKIIGVVGDA
jgi:hypothetical protein